MNKTIFAQYLTQEPKDLKEKYIFILDDKNLASAIILEFKALLLADDEENLHTVDSFIEYMNEIEFKGTFRTDFIYVPACQSPRLNSILEKYFKETGLEYHSGRQLFKNQERLAKLEYSSELKKTIEYFIKRFEGDSEGLNQSISSVLQLLDCKIEYDKNGNEKSRKVLQTIRNFEIIMENDDRFANCMKFNEFAQETFICGNVPWQENNFRAWKNYDDSSLFSLIQSEYGMKNRNDYFDALRNVSMKNRFHPVRELLDSLEWDGKEKIRSLPVDYLGVEDTEYNYQVFKLSILGGVARVYEPGCKFDYMTIFTGKQGLGKSTFLRKLAMKDEWFSDNLDGLDTNDALQLLLGTWILELAELKSFVRTMGGSDSIKRFLSSTQDKFRLPYERRTDTFPRQCIFFGTTNKSEFLQDETGNRRFLIVHTGINKPRKDVFGSEIEKDVMAAWAQAVHIWKTEKPQLILPDSCQEEAQRLQENSMADDGKVGIITEYLSNKQRTCAVEIWQKALGEQGRPQKWQAGEINNIILSLEGWEKMKSPSRFGTYGQQRGFQKMSTKPPLKCLQTATNIEGFTKIDTENQVELPFD